MYNSLQSLFFWCGIKCENHSASAILLKDLFNLDKIHKTFSKAKKERIDKQYYVTSNQTNPVTRESCKEMISIAGKFILEVDAYKRKLKLKDIEKIRKRLEKI